MKGVQFIVAAFGLLALSACGSAPLPPPAYVAAPSQYECRSAGLRSVVFLPVPNGQDKSVHVRMQGRSVPAVYLTKGLEQFWYFGQSTYITLRPDGTAVYMDFDGAEPEELRKPKSVFFCE